MKRRVQFDFSERLVREIDELSNLCDSSSRAETIRRSLGLLKIAVKNWKRGGKFLIEYPDGSREEVFIPVALNVG